MHGRVVFVLLLVLGNLPLQRFGTQLVEGHGIQGTLKPKDVLGFIEVRGDIDT